MPRRRTPASKRRALASGRCSPFFSPVSASAGAGQDPGGAPPTPGTRHHRERTPERAPEPTAGRRNPSQKEHAGKGTRRECCRGIGPESRRTGAARSGPACAAPPDRTPPPVRSTTRCSQSGRHSIQPILSQKRGYTTKYKPLDTAPKPKKTSNLHNRQHKLNTAGLRQYTNGRPGNTKGRGATPLRTMWQTIQSPGAPQTTSRPENAVRTHHRS